MKPLAINTNTKLKISDPLPLDGQDPIVNAINRLTRAVDSNKPIAKDNSEIIKLGEKLDKLVNVITNKPSSFEFDVRRGSDGYISKVIVKPLINI